MRSPRSKVPCVSFPESGIGARSPRPWLIILGILLSLATNEGIAAPAKAKNVLILFSSVDRNPHFTDVLEPALRSRVPGPITFYISYLTISQDPEQEKLYQESQAETFRRQYAGVKLDLVIAEAPQALLFSLAYRDKIFPGTPIVFTQVGTREFQGKTWPGVTGLTVPVGIGETIDLALRLHPDTTTVAIIQGKDWFWIGVAQSELLRYQNRVRTVVFSDDPSPDLLAKVRALPPHTVVLFHLPLPKESPSEFGTPDLLKGVAERWPTYSAWPENCLDHECIGGAYPDLDKEHLATAKIAARVLLGERPENIPIAQDSSLQVQVDWRQLQRWHIPDSALPAGSVILYREPTLWERYRDYVLAIISVIIVQALLIAALLLQSARKRKAEAVLRESEERFRLLANTSPALIWMCDAQGKTTYLNDSGFVYTGSQDAGYGDTWSKYVHPEDASRARDIFAAALKNRHPYSQEYRFRRNDGVYRWVFNVASPRMNDDGSFAGFIGSIVDITDQKLARETLRKLSGHLLEAQEKERTRIARELHDDVCQRLALLSLELGQASRPSNGSPNKLEEIRKQCSEIARDVQALSHRLHSSKLDYLGIVPALKGFCEEFSQQYEVTVDFTDRDVPQDVPHDVALCLFRITQEALRNAVKYSETPHFQVELAGASDELRLEVRDWGVGLDVDGAQRKHGLGLVSMRERVHLVSGRLFIESRRGEGTKIIAIVPLLPAIETPPGVEAISEATTETGAG
jgi:PAS domain S-box-containing protein